VKYAEFKGDDFALEKKGYSGYLHLSLVVERENEIIIKSRILFYFLWSTR